MSPAMVQPPHDPSILLAPDSHPSASYTKYLRPWNQVPSWEQCRKAINGAIEDAAAAPLEIELPLPSSPGGFDWRIFVANHEWREELLGHGGITKAIARKHGKTRHYHLLFSCVDGTVFMLTRNTLRRFDSNGAQHIVKSSDKAVKVAFRKSLEGLRKSGKRGPAGEEEGVVSQFNASLRDMMAAFVKDVLIGVPLGNPKSSDWVKLVDNPEVIMVKEDARMVPRLVDEDMKVRWVQYVREHFELMKMSPAQAAKLGQVKNDEIQEALRTTEGLPAMAAKLRRRAALISSPSAGAQSDVVLEPGTEVSIRLEPGVVTYKPFSFFVSVTTDECSGFLEVSRAPYVDDPLLEGLAGSSESVARRYAAADADRARPREVRPRYLPRLDTPTISSLEGIPDLSRDELVLSRLDETVDYQENSTSRGWKLTSGGNHDQQEPLAWHGAEFTLKRSQGRAVGPQKILLRLAELEGNLSIGLTECDLPSCVCRRKYPGAKQGKRQGCRNSVGFNSDGVKWNRGKPDKMDTYRMHQVDLLALVLTSAGTDKFARVEIGVSHNHSPTEIFPVKLESDSPSGGRLVIRASGRWTIDLLVGEGSGHPVRGAPLWRALPVVKEEPESEADCEMLDAAPSASLRPDLPGYAAYVNSQQHSSFRWMTVDVVSPSAWNVTEFVGVVSGVKIALLPSRVSSTRDRMESACSSLLCSS
ncbi:hypothetical protein FOL46_004202 [Perkinsus olseni]|uniref:Uncharacterized protein n=1 Tax=Perkinsus olseni TaxID=32597 RepID=A0A7J6LZS2_PEROL|nr:hypothetical protein FOL46_004202 [Perkinsus olseni]